MSDTSHCKQTYLIRIVDNGFMVCPGAGDGYMSRDAHIYVFSTWQEVSDWMAARLEKK